jgi:hypothetical protein
MWGLLNLKKIKIFYFRKIRNGSLFIKKGKKQKIKFLFELIEMN